jgi:lipoprotein-releasing system permease protein
MNLPLKIARRYLFAKKSTNAINIITGISVFGLTIGTAALIIVLSVFNGFEDLILGLVSNFNPEVKVTAKAGKVFEADSTKIAQIENLLGVDKVAQTLEEVAFFEYKGAKDVGILKGVSDNFNEVTGIDTMIREGEFRLKDEDRNLAVLGVGMRNKLSTAVEDYLTPVTIYMAKKDAKSSRGINKAFRTKYAYPAGTFSVQAEFDQQYIFSSLELARSLMNYDKELSSLEISLKPNESVGQVISQIQTILGEEFLVEDRYQQDAEFLKLMNIEKWLGFAIVGLTLILVAFNLIGSLWMIVIEKKKDIAILKSMGATDNTVRNIFLNEGFLLSLLGLIIGTVLALTLYVLQKAYGIVPLDAGLVVQSYPISLRWTDLIAVAVLVIFVGMLATVPVAWKAKSIPAMIQEE